MSIHPNSVEKLRGLDNYNSWKFLTKMLLISEDLWDSVESEKAADDKTQLKALARICLLVEPSVLGYVRNAVTAHEAWSNLQKAYEDRGLCRRLTLLRTLFAVKLEASMEAYLTKVCGIAQQLRDMEAALDDEFLAVIMLSGLTSDYDPLIMAIENSNVKLTSEVVRSKLLLECQRRDVRSTVDDDTALVSRGKVGSGSSYNNKQRKCFKCKKTGHFFKDCPLHKKKDQGMLSAMSALSRNVWYVDSGATNHMCNDRNILHDFKTNSPIYVSIANGDRMCSSGKGNVKVPIDNKLTTIHNVVYLPELAANLLSVTVLTQKGYHVVFRDDVCTIKSGSSIIGTARCTNGVYVLNTTGDALRVERVPCALSTDLVSTSPKIADIALPVGTSKFSSQEIWHRRLGHLNARSMYLMKKGLVTGMAYDDSKYQSCVPCVEGKQCRLPFPKTSQSRSDELLGLVHSDLCGPMPEQSFGGAKYFLTFIDDFSRKTFVYFLKSKVEVFEQFLLFKALVENQTGKKIKVFRSDNGTEYVNANFQKFLKENGIVHHTTIPYSPAQNGVSERANRTIMEKARCMLQDAGLEKRYWAEAVQTAVHIKNRSPTKAVRGATPEEIWTGSKVDVSHFRIFGCVAYALVQCRKKLDSKSKPYIFTGYCEESKGFRLLDPFCPTGKCVKARDVTFFEDKFLGDLKVKSNDDIGMVVPPADTQCSVERVSHSDDLRRRERRQELYVPNDTDDSINTSSVSTDNGSDFTYVPETTSMESEDSYESDFISASEFANMITLGYDIDEPKSVQEALDSKESDLWREAMQDELDSFNSNNCWTLKRLEKGQKPVKCRWIFKKKKDLKGNVVRYKARLVAKGFTQKYGIDYQETFAPVVRYSTIRMLFAIAAEYDLDIDQLDVKTAFLNGDLHENVLMEQPEGFVVKGKEDFVYKLNKSIYGLKQAAKCWYDKINETLLKMSFQKSSGEPCVYFRNENGRLTIIALYVDDILLFTASEDDKRDVKGRLMKAFEMKDLGEVREFLGFKIVKNKGRIIIDQSHYIANILEKFKMTDCKPVGTPMEPGLKLVRSEKTAESYEYRGLIGCLMYLAVCTRPDIAFAVSSLSQFNDCFSEVHWKAAKRVLRYLKGTMDYKLVYTKSGLQVSGYVDADWASCEVDRKSYTGFVYKIGKSVVSWECRKQKTVALSSTEAEYMALSDACKEALFIRSFMNECLSMNGVITLYNDNQSAQKLCTNHMFHARTKHIDVRHHFIRDIVAKQLVNICYLRTDEMTADILTKALSKEKFLKFVSQLCLNQKCIF